MNKKLAFIGGSGLYDLDSNNHIENFKIDTPWGNPSDEVIKTSIENHEVFFLPRHGKGHSIAPSNINYRANIDALKQLGITDIISISAVGSLKENLEPGVFVIVDQFIDKTFKRKSTFFDEDIVAHVSMANPTSKGLREICNKALSNLKIKFQLGGTYVAIEGPQFSSYAESQIYRSWKADVIGMTNMPEAKLAREAEIRYCSVSMVTDYDCWHPDHDAVDVHQIIKTLNANTDNAKKMIKKIINIYNKKKMVEDISMPSLDYAIITSKEKQNLKTKKKLQTIAGRVLNIEDK